jgi:DNA-binding LacI/PurR family transcriptional regulator
LAKILWKDIYERSVQELETSRLPNGALFGTVASLAKRYQVSAITARRVLSELANAGFVKNVPRVGSIVVRNAARLEIPCYFLPPELLRENPVSYAEIQRGLFTAAAAQNMRLQTITLDNLVELGTQTQPGILFSIWDSQHVPSEAISCFCPRHIFPIFMGCHRYTPERGICIGNDAFDALYRMVGQFAKEGCKHIAYLGASSESCFGPRFAGYLQGLKDNSLPFELHMLFQVIDIAQISPNEVLKWIEDHQFDAVCTPGTQFSIRLKQILENGNSSWQGRVATVGCHTERYPGVDLYRTDFSSDGELAIKLALEIMQPDGSIKQPEQRNYFNPAIFEPSKLFPCVFTNIQGVPKHVNANPKKEELAVYSH